jgi:hypothetical protein
MTGFAKFKIISSVATRILAVLASRMETPEATSFFRQIGGAD